MRELLDYVRERLLGPKILLLLLVLVGASYALDGVWPNTELWQRSLWAALLVGAFRLFDDIMDRERDRLAGRARVLVRTRQLWRFRALCALLFSAAFGLTAFWASWSVASIGGLYLLGLLLWYMGRDRGGISERLHAAVLFSKYPLMVLVLASAPRWFGILPVVYAGLLVFEWLDSADRPTEIAAAKEAL